MQKKDCFLVGTVFKLHGYKGNVNIYNDNDIYFDFSTINYFLIEQNNTLIPFFITKARYTKPNVILTKFENINSEKEALSIIKQKVYLPSNFLAEIDKTKTSKKQLVGLKVLDIKLGDLGKITYVDKQTAQQLIYVNKERKEFCFPMHQQFIININTEKGIMEVEIPEELINLNS